MHFVENWVTDIAKVCHISQTRVRELNFYQEGALTHFNQSLVDSQVIRSLSLVPYAITSVKGNQLITSLTVAVLNDLNLLPRVIVPFLLACID